MNCSRCGASIPENVNSCPACGAPVQKGIPEKPEIEYEELLTDFEDFLDRNPFGSEEKQAASPAPEKAPAESVPAVDPEEERRAKIKARKARLRRRRRRKFLRFLIILLILAGLGAYAWFKLLPDLIASRTPVETGGNSCKGLAGAYLDAVQLTEEEGMEEALAACVLPEVREEEEQTTIFRDDWTANYGKEVTDFAMGQVQLLDLSSSPRDVQILEEASGLTVQEVLLVPISVNYADGTSAQMTMKMVQSEEGYYLIAVN